jgi:GntR family transcriptional regulator
LSTRPALTLTQQVADDLRNRIRRGDFEAGDRLPGELRLVEEYGVSRATIRTALQDLESRGLIHVRRGLGSVVTPGETGVRADIRRLDSMSETIRAHGMEPGMAYRSLEVRDADPDERGWLDLAEGDRVLATERSLTADAELVAFSWDVVPLWIFGGDLDPTEVQGSLFEMMERHGVRAETAVTQLGAAHGPHIGWGDRPADASYLVLTQIHHDRDGRPVAYARTAFIDGRFQFGLVRNR